MAAHCVKSPCSNSEGKEPNFAVSGKVCLLLNCGECDKVLRPRLYPAYAPVLMGEVSEVIYRFLKVVQLHHYEVEGEGIL